MFCCSWKTNFNYSLKLGTYRTRFVIILLEQNYFFVFLIILWDFLIVLIVGFDVIWTFHSDTLIKTNDNTLFNLQHLFLLIFWISYEPKQPNESTLEKCEKWFDWDLWQFFFTDLTNFEFTKTVKILKFLIFILFVFLLIKNSVVLLSWPSWLLQFK